MSSPQIVNQKDLLGVKIILSDIVEHKSVQALSHVSNEGELVNVNFSI